MRVEARVAASAAVAALVWYLLARLAFELIGGSFFEGVLRDTTALKTLARFIAINLGLAAGAVLLYSGLRERDGPGALAVAKAAGWWWLVTTLIQAKWYGFGVIRLPDDYGVATFVITLAIAMAAMYAGATVLEKLEPE